MLSKPPPAPNSTPNKEPQNTQLKVSTSIAPKNSFSNFRARKLTSAVAKIPTPVSKPNKVITNTKQYITVNKSGVKTSAVCNGKSTVNCFPTESNFGVDNPALFKGSYIINQLDCDKSKTFKVKVQLEGQFGQDPNGGDPNPQYLQVYGPTYEVDVTAVRKGNRVTLYIPAISVSIPNSVIDPNTGGNTYGGPSYLIVSVRFYSRYI